MAEVYTIAGAPMLGQTGKCPAGWTLTPKGNCGGPPPKYFNAAAAALQRALNAKGAGLSVDGTIGPLTSAAVNRLLGSDLPIFDVAAQAVALTARVQAATGSAALPLPGALGEASPWLWALLGFELLGAGLASYGLVQRRAAHAWVRRSADVLVMPRRRAA